MRTSAPRGERQSGKGQRSILRNRHKVRKGGLNGGRHRRNSRGRGGQWGGSYHRGWRVCTHGEGGHCTRRRRRRRRRRSRVKHWKLRPGKERRRGERVAGVERRRFVKDHILTAEEFSSGRMEEEPPRAVGIKTKENTQEGARSELATASRGATLWVENICEGAPDTEALGRGTSAMPESMRRGVRTQRVGKKIGQARGMQQSVAPKRERRTSMSKKAPSGRGDETKPTLSNTILLGGVREGDIMEDAKLCTRGLNARVDKLATAIRVEDMKRAPMLDTGLPNPRINEGGGVSLSTEEVRGGVARVVVNKEEHKPMAITCSGSMRTPDIHVHKKQWGGRHGGSRRMRSLAELALHTSRTGGARARRGRRESRREVSQKASLGQLADNPKARVTETQVMEHRRVCERATRTLKRGGGS